MYFEQLPPEQLFLFYFYFCAIKSQLGHLGLFSLFEINYIDFLVRAINFFHTTTVPETLFLYYLHKIIYSNHRFRECGKESVLFFTFEHLLNKFLGLNLNLAQNKPKRTIVNYRMFNTIITLYSFCGKPQQKCTLKLYLRVTNLLSYWKSPPLFNCTINLGERFLTAPAACNDWINILVEICH